MRISEIDKNFFAETKIQREGLRYYSCEDTVFGLCGIFREGERFTRLPRSVAESVGANTVILSTNTAGGRVRFYTDSPYIAIRAELANICHMSHMTDTGSCGFDLYVCEEGTTEKFYGSMIPNFDGSFEGYEAVRDFPDSRLRLITLNFPLYNDVKQLYIGLSSDAEVSEAPRYEYGAPVVYYGSSITQGGCASRPGMSYQAILSRRLNVDHVNLGFSGNAKGEPAMAEYIAGLSMSAFVMDYDYNAPTAEHLAATHKPFFDIIRKRQPTLPIIIMTRPQHTLGKEGLKRLEIARATYETAIAEGDENVYFIDGRELMELAGCEGTVDGCHPTDLGFFSMANKIRPILHRALEKSRSLKER